MTDPNAFSAHLTGLQASAARLASLASGLDEAQQTQPSYASEWTIADVYSHLGSGATIMLAGVEAALAGESVPEGFNQSVWDEWNAKDPADQVRDSIKADDALRGRLAGFSPEERDRLLLPFGPMELDAARVAAMRLNEHALHTWDIETALDPSAALPPEVAALVVDNLEVIAGFAGRPTGADRRIRVDTSDPQRSFGIVLAPDSVAFTAVEASDAPDLTVPAESLARLVYGRLDPEHTPTFDGDGAALDELRQVFPGF